MPCLGLSEPGGKLTDGVVAPGGNDVGAACASASPATRGLRLRGIVMGCKQNWKHVYDETSISELQWGSEQLTLLYSDHSLVFKQHGDVPVFKWWSEYHTNQGQLSTIQYGGP